MESVAQSGRPTPTGCRNRCRVIGYGLPEDSARLEIFTAKFLPEGDDAYLGADDLSRLAGRAARVFGHVAARDLARFAGNDATANAARYIADEIKRIEDVRVHVLTNGLVRDRSVSTVEIALVDLLSIDCSAAYFASGIAAGAGNSPSNPSSACFMPAPSLASKHKAS